MNTKVSSVGTTWKPAGMYSGGTKGNGDDPEVVSFWNGFTNYSGGRALRIREGNDAVWQLGNQTTGVYDISMRVYVPANREAHIAVLGDQNNINSRLFDYVLNTNKTVWQDAAYKTYAQNEWIALKINLDLNAHKWSVSINGTNVYAASVTGLNQFGALELFSPSSFSEFYVDDLELKRSDIIAPRLVDKTIRHFEIYPNPAQDVFKISVNFDKPTDGTLTLYDIAGRLMWSKNLESVRQSEEIVDVRNLSQGIYFLKISPIGEAPQIQRVIVTK